MKAKAKAATFSVDKKLSYWWRCGQLETEIPEPLRQALIESANERIAEMLVKGLVSGELHDDVNIDIPGHQTPEDGWTCSGWWTLENMDSR